VLRRPPLSYGAYRAIKPTHIAAICGALGTPVETAAHSQAYNISKKR
jgi:hypothetical protein